MDKIVALLLEESTLWLPQLVSVVGILIFFYILSRFARHSIRNISKRLKLDTHLSSFLARVSSVILLILGVTTALGTLGVNISALVAGLGLTGFALGFALKDTISNMLSGVLILLYRPFLIGNIIKVAGYQGEVVSIDLRYTELDYEGDKILIPNSKLFTDPITILNSVVNKK